MKRLLLFLARLIAVSLLFVPFLSFLKSTYRYVLGIFVTGSLPASELVDAIRYDSSNNLYTFLILILGIPKIPIRKRIVAIVTGVAIFLSIDFFMAVIWPNFLMTNRPSLANMAVSYAWLVTAHYLLPFLLWFVFAFKEIEHAFRGTGTRHNAI